MTMAMKIQEEREEAKIETTIGLLSEFQWTKENIINKLIKDFDLTKEEAVEYYNQYLKEHWSIFKIKRVEITVYIRIVISAPP